jgi:hypothetical protein
MVAFSITTFKYSAPAFKFVLTFMTFSFSGLLKAVPMPIVSTPSGTARTRLEIVVVNWDE